MSIKGKILSFNFSLINNLFKKLSAIILHLYYDTLGLHALMKNI